VQGEILAEMQSRGVPQTFGYADVEAVVKDVVHCDRPEAKARVRRALACQEYTEGTHRVPATAPATAAALAEGTIGARHVDSILRTLAEIPGIVPEEERLGYEKILADLARESPPAAVDRAGRHLLERIEQDHLKTDRPLRVRPERELNWAWNRDRQLCFAGRLDAVSGALFEKLLSPLAKPRPGPFDERDTRPIDQRHGDAFAELLDHTQRAADLPTEAGETPALILTMNLADLIPAQRDGTDAATMRRREPPLLSGDMPISAEEARCSRATPGSSRLSWVQVAKCWTSVVRPGLLPRRSAAPSGFGIVAVSFPAAPGPATGARPITSSTCAVRRLRQSPNAVET